jgi:hypothetical protein
MTVAWAGSAAASLVAEGDSFLVNENSSAGEQAVPRVAVNASGSAIVVWESEIGDGDGLGIFGRVYDSAGVAVGAEFQVNSYTTGPQISPAADALADGSFVVVWETYNLATGDDGLFGQRFGADGLAVGSEFRVDISISYYHVQADVAARPDGSFVVVWDDYIDIFGLQMNTDGTPLGTEFFVNDSLGSMSGASIGAASDGSFVVGWTDRSDIDGDAAGVLARLFASDGSPNGTDLLVNTSVTGDQYAAVLDVAPGGEFLVVWETYGQVPEGDGLYAQLFDSGGAKRGSQFRVDAGNSVYAGAAAVAAAANGEFVVVWNEPIAEDSYIYSIVARRVDSAGQPTSEPIDVDAESPNDQSQASVAADPNGEFLVVWRQDLDDGDIVAQRLASAEGTFTPPPTPTNGPPTDTPTMVPPTHTPSDSCPGDCDGDGQVSIGELITAVNIALGLRDIGDCGAANTNGDNGISISELIGAVNSALEGCVQA